MQFFEIKLYVVVLNFALRDIVLLFNCKLSLIYGQFTSNQAAVKARKLPLSYKYYRGDEDEMRNRRRR